MTAIYDYCGNIFQEIIRGILYEGKVKKSELSSVVAVDCISYQCQSRVLQYYQLIQRMLRSVQHTVFSGPVLPDCVVLSLWIEGIAKKTLGMPLVIFGGISIITGILDVSSLFNVEAFIEAVVGGLSGGSRHSDIGRDPNGFFGYSDFFWNWYYENVWTK